MSMLNKCHDLSKRIIDVSTKRKIANEANELKNRLKEIIDVNQEVELIDSKIKFFSENQLSLSYNMVARENTVPSMHLKKVIDSFAEEPNLSSLSQGRDWVHFKESEKLLINIYNELLNKTWAHFVSNEFSGEKPKDLNLAATDQNRENLESYKEEYEKLKNYAQTFPSNSDSFQKVKELAKTLISIREQFDLNVPDDVAKFLSNIVNDGSAPLHLLTQEVILWLKKNNNLEQYKIVRG